MDFIKTRAAVAWAPKQPLVIEELDLMPPQKGEVLVRIVASGVCHTDAYTLDGLDAEGVFPCVLGHEGAGVVVAVGEGVSSVKPGDHVIPLYTAECGECEMCTSGKTNLCSAVRATQGKGLMPDGTVRFFKDGQPIYHYMGCSTFSEYTVVAEVSLAKIQPEADLHEICLLGCGVTTGMGAVIKTAKVQAGDSVAIFGLGGIGLAAVIGARMVGAGRIIGIDTNPDKFAMARKLGATDCINPRDYDKPIQDVIIGVAPAGAEIRTRPFQLVTGRVWRGSAFGGVKGRSELPGIVQQYLDGKFALSDFITTTMPLDDINRAFDLMHEGKAIRSVIHY